LKDRKEKMEVEALISLSKNTVRNRLALSHEHAFPFPVTISVFDRKCISMTNTTNKPNSFL